MYNTLEPVTTKEFEQSLFVMLAIIVMLILGAYFLITYNAPLQAEQTPQINQFSQQNGTLYWNIGGIKDEHVIQLEVHQGNIWLLVGNELASGGQYTLGTTPQEYRLVVRDATGNVLQESIIN
ncbi:MAG: hypothetical protein L0154_31230 [Chloroflexi bacterium]|nr:hypothetical protein [Chloroflexota bacterium]